MVLKDGNIALVRLFDKFIIGKLKVMKFVPSSEAVYYLSNPAVIETIQIPIQTKLGAFQLQTITTLSLFPVNELELKFHDVIATGSSEDVPTEPFLQLYEKFATDKSKSYYALPN